MQISEVYTENKNEFILDILADRISSELNILVFFNSAILRNSTFDMLSKDHLFLSSTVDKRNQVIHFKDNTVKFMKADWSSFCGMQYDIAIVYDDDIDNETILRILSKVRGANDKEKSMFVLNDISSYRLLNANPS